MGPFVTGLEPMTHVLNESAAQRGGWDKADFLYLSSLIPSLSALTALGYFQILWVFQLHHGWSTHSPWCSPCLPRILTLSHPSDLSWLFTSSMEPPWPLETVLSGWCVQFMALWVSLHSTCYSLLWIWALLVCSPLFEDREGFCPPAVLKALLHPLPWPGAWHTVDASSACTAWISFRPDRPHVFWAWAPCFCSYTGLSSHYLPLVLFPQPKHCAPCDHVYPQSF